MPTKAGLLLVHDNNFGQMPFPIRCKWELKLGSLSRGCSTTNLIVHTCSAPRMNI